MVQADGMYQLQLTGMGPAGMVVQDADTTLAASAIIFEAPMVNRMAPEFYKEAQDGMLAELDAEQGSLTLLGE